MKLPASIARSFSRDPERSRTGAGSHARWAAKHCSSVPANAWTAAAAAAAAALGLGLIGPSKDPSKLYEIAAQVVPAFLIALAVERSLRDSLGTKADFARTRRDETADSYSARGLSGGIRNTIEFAMLKRQGDGVRDGDDALLSVSVEPLDVAQALIVGHWDDDPMTWSLFRDLLHDEFGLPADDPDFFDPPEEWSDPSPAFEALHKSMLSHEPGRSLRWLAARAVLQKDRAFAGGTVGNQLLGAELSRLFDAQRQSTFDRVLKQVTYRANLEYDRQRKHRTLSLRISILLLTTTEFMALIGVMSPGRPYSGLFVITAALVVASVLNVAGGALADLKTPRAPAT